LTAFAVLAVLSTGVYAQTLTHSYTFEDLAEGNITNDTLVTNFATGEQDATLKLVGNGTATNDGGVLLFNGTDVNNGAYILLPSDIIGSKTAITLETWVKPNALLNYSRAWDLGDTDNNTRFFNALTAGTDGQSYTYFQERGTDPGRYQLTAGEEYLLTVTAEQVSDTSTRLTYYVNGACIGSATGDILLSRMVGNENFLGKSHWGDSLANANFKEFNVYDGAMGPTQVNAQKIMGANSDHNAFDRETTLANAAKTDELIKSAEGYWNFGASKGVDLSDKGRNIGINGSISSEADSSLSEILTSDGYYLHDQSSSNSYAYITDANLSSIGMDSFTLATRVKMDSFKSGEGSYDDLIRSGTRGQNNAHYSLSFTDGGKALLYGSVNGEYKEYFFNSIDSETGAVTPVQFEPDKWYDLSVTFEKGDDYNPSILTLYAFDPITGEELTTTVYELAGNAEFHSPNGEGDFLLFEVPWNDHGNNNGYMDYAGVWGYALTANELQSLFGAATSVPEPSTWALMALGVIVLFLRKRVRN
jgi:hypothetical protein